jgi:hypothetical protein
MLSGIGMRKVVISYGHLVHFNGFWSFIENLVYFLPLWYIVSRKIWQPWLRGPSRNSFITCPLKNFTHSKSLINTIHSVFKKWKMKKKSRQLFYLRKLNFPKVPEFVAIKLIHYWRSFKNCSDLTRMLNM